MIKIFVEVPLAPGKVFEIKGENHHHLQVIRVNKGDEIVVGDNDFCEFIAEITDVTKKGYLARTSAMSLKVPSPIRDITLYVSLPKRKKFEDIIFKCTQVGVSEFVPIVSSRTIKRLKDTNNKKLLDRWEKKARYGAELSGRKRIPHIGDIISFEKAVGYFIKRKFCSGILFWEQEGKTKYLSKKDMADKMAVFIGPEGGFSQSEIEFAGDNGIKIRSLGKLVMEVETACIAGVSLLLCGEHSG